LDTLSIPVSKRVSNERRLALGRTGRLSSHP
jgi:hypothetical protein